MIGNAAGIKNTLSGRTDTVLSGSKNIASDISGSFLGHGTRAYLGQPPLIINSLISGSAITTGSFHKLSAKQLRGDGTHISASVLAAQSFLTGSSEIAERVSGSFTSGFEITSYVTGSSARNYHVGVSGSRNFEQGASGSTLHGSDMDPDLQYCNPSIHGASWSGTWKNCANMVRIQGTSHGATGTANAMIVGGGNGYCDVTGTVISAKKSEEFDGTAWSVLPDMYGGHTTPNAGAYMGGTVHAAWITAAYNYVAPQNNYSGTEEWNGVNWYDSANTNTPRRYGTAQGSGTVNAGIIAGGKCSSLYACTELYNGNVWTEVADLIQASVSHAAVGTQNDSSIAFGDCSTGGGIAVNACAHQGWDGTSWRVLSNPAPQAIGRTAIGGGTTNDSVWTSYQMGAPLGGRVCYFDGTAWSNLGGAFNVTRTCSGVGGDGNATGLVMTGGCAAGNAISNTEIWEGYSQTTGSFGNIKPTDGGLVTEAFQVTSSLFQLPVFNDIELNYGNREPQLQTGSLSGSVCN